MLTAFASLLFAVVPLSDGTLAESCDLIELNHFYDEKGSEVFIQNIFYDWSDRESRFNVRAWRLVKHESQLPYPAYGGGPKMYRALWLDGDVNRLIYAPSYRETWTQYDPELAEREILPKEQRRELRTMKVSK